MPLHHVWGIMPDLRTLDRLALIHLRRINHSFLSEKKRCYFSAFYLRYEFQFHLWNSRGHEFAESVLVRKFRNWLVIISWCEWSGSFEWSDWKWDIQFSSVTEGMLVSFIIQCHPLILDISTIFCCPNHQQYFEVLKAWNEKKLIFLVT